MKPTNCDKTKLDLIPDLAKVALDAIKASRERINLEIESITGKIVSIEKEKSKSKNGLVSLEDYSAFLLQEIQGRADNYARLWLGTRHSSQSGRAAGPQHSVMRWPDFEQTEVGKLLSEVLKPDVTSDALCFLFPDVMHDRLMTCLRAGSAGKWATGGEVSIAKRRGELQSIEDQIYELNEQRDSLFRQLNDINNAVQIR